MYGTVASALELSAGVRCHNCAIKHDYGTFSVRNKCAGSSSPEEDAIRQMEVRLIGASAAFHSGERNQQGRVLDWKKPPPPNPNLYVGLKSTSNTDLGKPIVGPAHLFGKRG